ncbi:MAG: hypothetical protein HN413_10310 [Chloroflexi bacterium]|jgi:alpha-2-macroglobulin|nr:hypothetical protein [Chloroflexota bacterium]
MNSKFTQPHHLFSIISTLFALLVIMACSIAQPFTQNPEDDQTLPLPYQGDSTGANAGESTPEPESEETGFVVMLSDGQPRPQSVEPLPVAAGEPLGNADLARVLARLPELATTPADQLDFNLPDDVLPPPRPGETIVEAFPPEEGTQPMGVESGPLEVLRYAPEGEIPIAPFINITFNQPMVPLTTLADLAAADVPVIVEPPLPGTWRWLGTKTLNFQYDSELIDRLPKATEYTVTIPAGTQSATGSVLADAVQFTFSTPPPVMQNSYPYDDAQPLEPLIFASFDQRIQAAAVLETISITADGAPVAVRIATDEEIAADETIQSLTGHTLESRWLVFRPLEPLPTDAYVEIRIGPGTPSAEGPLLTQSAQSFSFHTYAPLQIVDYGCSHWDDECRPLMPFYIEFNNPIDVESYTEAMLRISPELPGASLDVIGDTITIRGASQGQTTYTVTVDGAIRDVFGQSLGEAEQLKFRVGSAEPFLIGPDELFVTLDPSATDPALSLYTMNYDRLNVRVYAVQPSDWPDFLEYMRRFYETDRPGDPPGEKVRDNAERIDAPSDSLAEVQIDLSEYLKGATGGQFVVIVEPPNGLFQQDNYWETVHTWVQVTQIGLDAFADASDLVVWATALVDGKPLEGVSIGASGANMSTDAEGVARFAIPDGGVEHLTARLGDDTAMLPRSTYYWGGDSWHQRAVYDELRWFVFDDRQMYKPGEEVHLKGWLRLIGGGQRGDVGLAGDGITAVSYDFIGSQGNEIGSGSVDVNALGGFDFSFTLPDNANLGYASIQFNVQGSLSGSSGSDYYHSFQIQEFRRPEFEVNARNESVGPYFAGDSAMLAVEAKYFAGGPLPNAETTWWVTSSPTNYQPPNWPDFSFGYWTPWWWWGWDGVSADTTTETFTGLTDAAGEHFLGLEFGAAGEPRPYSIMAEASVMDVNRQAWNSSTSLMVHPADLYVGLRSERYFVERGTSLEIELIVTDLDGNPAPGRAIEVVAARLEWKYLDGTWQEQEVDPQECAVQSGSEPVNCTFSTEIGGRYQITAAITDEQERQNQSRITRWVSGGEQPPSREVEQETATLIPDKDSYQPGDVAEILVQSPFSPSASAGQAPTEGLLTVSRSGMLYTERFTLDGGTVTLHIPIEEAHIPNLNVQVDLVGSALRLDDQGEPVPDAPPRPAYASGTLNLSIPPLQRTLALDLSLEETELEPGGSTMLSVMLADANGAPVANAELAVVVVDEAILALTGYQMRDPVSAFYSHRPADLSSLYGRASIILADPMALADAARSGEALVEATATAQKVGGAIEEAEMALEAAPAPAAEGLMADMDDGNAAAAPIAVRADFNPLATFAPTVYTDEMGAAQVEIDLPDNLTRYRVMVVAVDSGGQQFGSAEANLTARLPLMVRPSAPRFLNFGDSFELPIVLQNQTDDILTVDVVVQGANIILTDTSSLRVEVPANDRIEVRFPAATDMAGTATFQIAAVSGNYADAATVELPVYTPATTEAFATYGVVDEGAIAQPIARPTDVFPQFGGLEIQTSSTALQALTDAVMYLVGYPYECSEQLSSRIIGVAALRDVLTAFEAVGLPSPEAMESAVQRDIERLSGMQNWDGGFPYWRRGQDSIPFNTIHVAHALQRAQLKGFDVPTNLQENVLYYLQDIESHYPYWYSQNTRWTLSAYALYVRDLMDDSDPVKAQGLLDEAGLENLSLEAVGWIWSVLVDAPGADATLEAIRIYVGNRVVETAGAANFTTSYDEQSYLLLSSNRRTDAILLDSLIADNPQSDLIPKLVTGLLAHRTRGHWGSTQENVFVLLTLDRYFNTYESQTPDFVARIWLGETYAGDHAYEGYTTERHETNIPMEYLVSGADLQDLVLSKEGTGRLYYRLGLSYAPTDLNLPPLDMGFVVTREYEAVDDPEDVTRDEDGVWHIKAGARVRVRLSMVADNRRYHVALVDPLPAGLEIVNPALAVSGSVPQDPGSSDYRYGWWWWGTWYEHQNMRDERAEAFTSLLWDGVYKYTYIARATTPGTFVAPPAKAEEMYSPEVFGRSASDWVIVED